MTDNILTRNPVFKENYESELEKAKAQLANEAMPQPREYTPPKQAAADVKLERLNGVAKALQAEIDHLEKTVDARKARLRAIQRSINGMTLPRAIAPSAEPRDTSAEES